MCTRYFQVVLTTDGPLQNTLDITNKFHPFLSTAWSLKRSHSLRFSFWNCTFICVPFQMSTHMKKALFFSLFIGYENYKEWFQEGYWPTQEYKSWEWQSKQKSIFHMWHGHLKLTCLNMSLPKKLVLLKDDCHLLFKGVIPNLFSFI